MIAAYFKWWLGCVEWVVGPITYFLWGVGTPFINTPNCQGTPNGVLLMNVMFLIAWILFGLLTGLIAWGALVRHGKIEDRYKTWQFWFGFLVGLFLGPAIFMAIVAVGAMITGACKGDKKE
jgi:hypothetical protein